MRFFEPDEAAAHLVQLTFHPSKHTEHFADFVVQILVLDPHDVDGSARRAAVEDLSSLCFSSLVHGARRAKRVLA